MKMNITKEGVLHIDLFDVETQEEQDQFIYYYLGSFKRRQKEI